MYSIDFNISQLNELAIVQNLPVFITNSKFISIINLQLAQYITVVN